MGLVQGPHGCTTGARKARTTGPGYPPHGRAAGIGRAPDARRPSQQRELPPSKRPTAIPAARDTLQGTRIKGRIPGLHTRTTRAQKNMGNRAQLPAQRRATGRWRAPGARRPSPRCEVPPPRGNPPPPPRLVTARRARKPKRQCRVPAPAYPRPQRVGSGPRLPAPRTGSPGRTST